MLELFVRCHYSHRSGYLCCLEFLCWSCLSDAIIFTGQVIYAVFEFLCWSSLSDAIIFIGQVIYAVFGFLCWSY